jgi:hypothetical protein
VLGTKIEDCLVTHFDAARTIMEDVLGHDHAIPAADSSRALTLQAFERVKARARSEALRTRE